MILFEPGHWQRFKKDNGDDGYDVSLTDSSASSVEEEQQLRSEDYVVTGQNMFLTASSHR